MLFDRPHENMPNSKITLPMNTVMEAFRVLVIEKSKKTSPLNQKIRNITTR